MSPPFARIVFIVISEFMASLTFIHFYFSLYITVFLLHQSKQALMQIILLCIFSYILIYIHHFCLAFPLSALTKL